MADDPKDQQPMPPARKRGATLVHGLSVLYLSSALAGWGLLRFGDSWWPATFFLFAPRWLLVLPLLLLAPLAIWRRPRSCVVLLAAGIVVLGPVMGLVIPVSRVVNATPDGRPLRLLSCNMHYGMHDSAPLDELVGSFKPDVVLLQEWDRKNQSPLLMSPDWHRYRTAALFIASRFPIKRSRVFGRFSMDPQGAVASYELSWSSTGQPLTVFNLHLASPRRGLAEVADDRPGGVASLVANSGLRRRQSSFIAERASRITGPLLLAGDFNTPPESELFRSIWQGYDDAFATAGWGWGYTFTTRLLATRIDHILLGKGWYCARCRVGPSVGSPHRPVLAELLWQGEAE